MPSPPRLVLRRAHPHPAALHRRSVARVSVSGPTWTSRCNPTETLSRVDPKAYARAREPCEGATPDKAVGSLQALVLTHRRPLPWPLAPVTASTPSLVTTV